MIIPSIDLMDGKAVQLKQGKEKVLERDDVIALAKEFSTYGELAIIDLDAALGIGDNLELVKKICAIADCRVGGGIRSRERARELLQAGAKKIIIGTKASPDFLKDLPKERIIVAIDTKDGEVVTEGWTKSTKRKPGEVMKELEPYCSEFLFTNVNKEGLMQGYEMEIIKKLSTATKNGLTVAGGIPTLSDIEALESLNCNAQIGMAIYTGKIDLSDAFINVLRFDTSNGLLPTIVQDESRRVLMLAWSNKESLRKTFRTGKATYFSRSRNELWTKGGTSGNTQEFLKARYDCDRDALIFTVKQENVACHLQRYSCFDEKDFTLEDLYEVIRGRVTLPQATSYTSRIVQDETVIKEKIQEEAREVVNYESRSNLIWEIADLTYFVLVLMAKNNISLSEIKNELWGRRK